MDQIRGSNGLGGARFDAGLVVLYSLPSKDFNSALAGSNGLYTGPQVTGQGTPVVAAGELATGSHAGASLAADLASWVSFVAIPTTDTDSITVTTDATTGTVTIVEVDTTTDTTLQTYAFALSTAVGLTINTGSNHGTITFDQTSEGLTSGSNLPDGVNIQGSGNLRLVLDGGTMTFASNLHTSTPNLTLEAGANSALTFTSPQTLSGLIIDSTATVETTTGAISASTINDGGTLVTDPASGGGGITLASHISGSGSLVQQGSGKLVLSATNTYSGGTTINAGTLAYAITNALPTFGAVNVNGGTLAMVTFNGTLGAVTLSSGQITGSGGKLAASSYTLDSGIVTAILDGAGTLTTGDPGTVILAAHNTYTGGTTVSQGELVVGTSGALPVNTSLTIGSAGFLQITSGAGSQTLSSMSISTGGTLDVTNNGLVINYGSPGSDPITPIQADLATGAAYSSGSDAWTGSGITSSTAAGDPSKFGVGYLDGDTDPPALAGNYVSANQIKSRTPC